MVKININTDPHGGVKTRKIPKMSPEEKIRIMSSFRPRENKNLRQDQHLSERPSAKGEIK